MGRRADDVLDLCNLILLALREGDEHPIEGFSAGSVLVANQILPSDVIQLAKRSAGGIVMKAAVADSHAAFLIRELGIPAVGQIDSPMQRIAPGNELTVDGTEGSVVVAHDAGPSEETV
jgi:phosphoenolpyruvate-protein kinase (PTS system EI component)